MYAALEQMGHAHPDDPCRYLAWLAVARGAQGRGLGASLLTRCLETVTASRQAAYLETLNPRTVPFYEPDGFAVVGSTHGGSCATITFMQGPAR
jgi:GNAT superfamily N-acetyltransferase